MTFPLVPPPASDIGAFTIPRQLMRWLDVNPATKLTRTQGYITLPAFSANQTWNGYSDIVASFNYEGPNNFTLYGFDVEPLITPNYCLCISWRTNGVMNRYSLWRGAGEVFYFNVPVYTGQKIGKNFRFEIWSTNSTPSTQVSPITIYTSVLGGIDYRWGTDFVLVSSDGINTSFAVNAAVPAVPSGVFVGFDGRYGSAATWQSYLNTYAGAQRSYIGSSVTESNTDPLLALKPFVYGLQSVPQPYSAYPSNFGGVAGDKFIVGMLINTSSFNEQLSVLSMNLNTNQATTDIGIIQHTSDSGYGESTGYLETYFTSTISTRSSLLQANTWYVVLFMAVVGSGTIQGHAIPLTQTALIPDFINYNFGIVNSVAVSAGINTISNSYTYLGASAFSAQLNYAELIGAIWSPFIEQAMINYFFNKYRNTFNLPLTFPATSVSVTN